MAFCCERPVVSLAGPGEVDTFIMDVFQPRPSCNEMVRFQAWGSDASKKMHEAMTRKNCAVGWVQLVMDQHGFLAILRFKHPVILASAKTAANVILKCLPDGQRSSVHQGLRPFDEVDRDRIMAWATVESLRPKRQRQEEEDEEEEAKVFFKRRRTEDAGDAHSAEQPKKKTAAELLAELASDSESEAEAIEQPRLMLTESPHAAAPSPSTLALLDSFDPASVWEHRAKQEATVHVASTGERPATLSYIRCHREARRVQLLVEHLRKEYEKVGLLTVVRVAAQLAEDGSLPGHDGPRARKTEFIRRCEEALVLCAPEAERTTPSCEIRRRITHIIDGTDAPRWDEKMCMACGDKNPGWTTSPTIGLRGESPGEISRCKKCQAFYSYGRTWSTLLPITRDKTSDQKGWLMQLIK